MIEIDSVISAKLPPELSVRARDLSLAYARGIKAIIQEAFPKHPRIERTQFFFAMLVSAALSAGVWVLRKQASEKPAEMIVCAIAGTATGVAGGLDLQDAPMDKEEIVQDFGKLLSAGIDGHRAMKEVVPPKSEMN